jgi:hypothetical protein
MRKHVFGEAREMFLAGFIELLKESLFFLHANRYSRTITQGRKKT